MDRFPKMLFCFPALALAGAFSEALQDGTYGIRTVASDEEHDAALAEGWCETPADARRTYTDRIAAALEPETPAVDDNAPPTRAELEAKATELSITFRSNTSDKALADRIAAALEP